MSAYIEALRRQTIYHNTQPPKQQTLEGCFLAWYGDLPPEGKCRPFSMCEIETALNSQGRFISAILVRYGWKRKRIWSAQRYCRYWVPPP